MSTDFKYALAVILSLGVGLYVGSRYLKPESDGVMRQRLNLLQADKEVLVIQALLRDEERFSSVKAVSYTAQDGSILLYGSVRAEADLFQLMKAVAEAELSVAVVWQVKVRDEEEQGVPGVPK
jgi:hypothetical protein